MIEKKVVGRGVAITFGIICVVLAAGLAGVIANYTSMIGAKDSTIADLQSQVNDLNNALASKDSQIQTLTNEMSQLQAWLEGNVTSLNAVIAEMERLEGWLEGNKTLLVQTQMWLQANITYYNSQIDSLNAQITSLESEITSLNAQITTLEGAITTLQNQYQAYVTAYQSLRERVNQRWNQVNVEPFITPKDQSVCDIVYSITGGWSNLSDFNEFWDDVKAMYNWVVNNIDYRYDGLFPILPTDPSGEVDYWNEMWQFPNETLSLRMGDCEDMAILLCSMIRCYSNMICYAECIGITSSTAGHLAVQIPVEGHKLVIFDPAGRYYSHDWFGNIVFNDVSGEINSWLNYWKPQMGEDIYVDLVFSDYIHKTFMSTADYLSWMYSR